MNDHPDLQDLPAPPPTALERLIHAQTQAVHTATFLALMVLLPVIVWLWRWAI